MRRIWLLLLLAGLPAGAAGHRALLPRPQEIHYGGGSLAVKGLAIRFAMDPAPEDRFAADLLRSRLPAANGVSGPSLVLRRTGEAAPLPAADEQAGPDSRESYTLTISPQGGEIRARSSAGLFYGVQTLLEMIEGDRDRAELPAVQIRDWPALPYRGFMMDTSHGQLLRVPEIERQIDLLARFKVNQYYFYSEASIELDGYSLVNPDGRYTRDQIRQIIAYARQRHVDVVPCLELYGHLHDIFRVERFAGLALPRYGREFDPRNPGVLRMLDGIVEQTTRLFPSPWYHVGFDEPWSLGKIGVSGGADPYKVYLGVLRHVAEAAQKRGKRVMFWADMLSGARIFSNHPELIPELPKDAIAVPWVYDDRADFSPYLEPLARNKVPHVAAPGVWNWNEIFPDYNKTFRNINGLIAAGRKYGAMGVLNTGWTDSAQTIYRMSLPGLALGGVASWQSAPADRDTFFQDYASQMYPPAAAAEAASALDELSDAEEIFTKALGGPTVHQLWMDPLAPDRLRRVEQHQQQLRQARLLAEAADEHLQKALALQGDPASLESLLLAARMLDYLGMKTLYAAEWAGYFRRLQAEPRRDLIDLYLQLQIASQDHGMLTDLMDAITGLRERYRKAWLEESTPYRLGTALARWDAESEYWRAMQARIPELIGNYKPGAPFPSIDSLRPNR